MPRLDGYGLLAKLREDDNLGEVPIILLSARAGEEAKVEGLRAGADNYLVKPFSVASCWPASRPTSSSPTCARSRRTSCVKKRKFSNC